MLKKSKIQVIQATISGAMGGLTATVNPEIRHEDLTVVKAVPETRTLDLEGVLTPIQDSDENFQTADRENVDIVETQHVEHSYDSPETEYEEGQKGYTGSPDDSDIPDYVNDADINAYI